jgi:hypothetical protein
MSVCDFCSEADPAWVYPARDFVFGISRSAGGWAACDRCHDLIEAGDSSGLADRSLLELGRWHVLTGEDEVELLAALRAIHLGFWASRVGPAQPQR